MEIVQKRFSNKATFSFGDSDLRYTIRDSSSSQSFSIPYGSIRDDVGEFEERNVWYRNVGIFWVGLGLLQVGTYFAEHGQLRGSIWLTLGLVCFVVYWTAKTSFSVIDTEKGRLFIIKNAQHEQIMKELETRRAEQWRQWYGHVDLANDPEKEIGKFQWLKERKIISETEYNEAVARISQHHDLPGQAGVAEATSRRLN